MTNKIKHKKHTVPKKIKSFQDMTFAEKVAHVSGCTERYANMVLSGTRAANSSLATHILINAERIKENDRLLLKKMDKGSSKMYIEQ